MAGAITAAMRAARAGEGTRVLRVARVERGRIVDERVLHASTDVEGATLLRRGDRWELALADGARARVADSDGAREWAGGLRLPLAPDARGKIVAGEVAHLFQVVVAAPRATPQLPLSVVARAERIDLRFAMVAAVSLFVHFGFVGAVQADFMDPTVDDDRDATSLVLEARARPSVTTEDKGDRSDEKVAEAKPSEPDPSGPKASPSAHAGEAPGPAAAHAAPPKSAAETLDAMNGKLDDLGLSTIGSMQQGGPPKPNATSQASDGSLDELAEKKAGVEVDGPAIKGDSAKGDKGDGPFAASTKPGFDLGETKTKPLESPKPTPTTEPTVNKANEPAVAPAIGNTPKDVDAVIARNRWRFRACYSKELLVHPDARGTVKVRVGVDDDGGVGEASIVSSDFSSSLNACVLSAFKAMKFSSDENKCLFAVPVTLTQGK